MVECFDPWPVSVFLYAPGGGRSCESLSTWERGLGATRPATRALRVSIRFRRIQHKGLEVLSAVAASSALEKQCFLAYGRFLTRNRHENATPLECMICPMRIYASEPRKAQSGSCPSSQWLQAPHVQGTLLHAPHDPTRRCRVSLRAQHRQSTSHCLSYEISELLTLTRSPDRLADRSSHVGRRKA